ncbi:UvrB/UvrC motif-containing protein [Paenibacillus sp. MMS20-IR301]|uniref:UvrB/UvrC motif-containing protein n=1 Tax=Paenibacillus sp. MMS20-IR301 TaxID=2895946 RepID=UPI0028E97958|nr:UvrB/UvrC motif-containing protein [Paenibacillus sp. MMS20-IR301]WNS42407.1 UvrB/UvrC motif-containing protein [Paenibacillus sp. MMS20-IR301]
MPSNLSDKVADLPLTPGVYLMKDSLGHIIYVGKAKQLKKRVQSYFYNNKGHSPKVKQLVKHIRDLEYRLTDTEFEAFMLECQLIKEIKPMYNRKMKNPLAYSYISIVDTLPYRQIEVGYEPSTQAGSLSFGPYTSRSTVERAVLGIKESQRILCSSPHSRNTRCLNHSLGLCIGMCGGGRAVQQYEEIIDQVIGLLNGSGSRIASSLEARMEEASQRFDFETAAKYRDYLGAVHSLQHKEQVIGFTGENNNIIVLEPVDEHTHKLILIKGSVILYRARLASADLFSGQLTGHITAAALEHFRTGSLIAATEEISRHRIDEAQIIYSYLKGSSGSYLMVPQEWLEDGGIAELEQGINRLIGNSE